MFTQMIFSFVQTIHMKFEAFFFFFFFFWKIKEYNKGIADTARIPTPVGNKYVTIVLLYIYEFYSLLTCINKYDHRYI